MSEDLEYFTEFLENPSAPPLDEFYEMLNKWGTYVIEHKANFNYLKDKKWKKIRERLVAEVRKRDSLKKKIDADWEKSSRILEDISKANPKDVLEAMKTQLHIMVNYRKLHEFTDADISGLEKDIADYTAYMKNAWIAQQAAQMAKLNLDNSIVNLDEMLAKYMERTGKTPVLPNFPEKKTRRGN